MNPAVAGGVLMKYVNCAGCEMELLGDSLRDWHDALSKGERRHLKLPPPVKGRWKGRPYCPTCLPYVLADAGQI